jgi:integrase
MPNASPDGLKRNVTTSGPARRLREREHLTPKEVESLIEAARKGRWGLRDATVILMCFSHGLRLSEALRLRWTHLDLDQGIIHLRRLKNGLGGDHRLRGVEIRALRRMRRQNRHPAGDYVFTSERGSPLGSRTVHCRREFALAYLRRAIVIHLHSRARIEPASRLRLVIARVRETRRTLRKIYAVDLPGQHISTENENVS